MAALLVGLSVMAVLMTMAMPAWTTMVKREKEAELIWRGEQYARAVALFQRKYANTFPPSLDVLVDQRFLRKKYKDPVTNDDFQVIPAGGSVMPGQVSGPNSGDRQGNTGTQITFQAAGGQQGANRTFTATATQAGSGMISNAQGLGVQGVVSKSKDSSLKIYNGRTKYNEWAFVALATARGIQAPQQGGPAGSGGQNRGAAGGRAPGSFDMGGASFTPLGGVDRRPGVGPPQFPPAGGQPFGRPGMPPPGAPGQPSPFAPPPPFGQPGPPPRPPGR